MLHTDDHSTPKLSATVIDVLYAILGILSKDDDDDDKENGKKAKGLDK